MLIASTYRWKPHKAAALPITQPQPSTTVDKARIRLRLPPSIRQVHAISTAVRWRCLTGQPEIEPAAASDHAAMPPGSAGRRLPKIRQPVTAGCAQGRFAGLAMCCSSAAAAAADDPDPTLRGTYGVRRSAVNVCSWRLAGGYMWIWQIEFRVLATCRLSIPSRLACHWRGEVG